jgi:hypothetical protein
MAAHRGSGPPLIRSPKRTSRPSFSSGQRKLKWREQANALIDLGLSGHSEDWYPKTIDPYRDCPGRCGAWERSVLPARSCKRKPRWMPLPK